LRNTSNGIRNIKKKSFRKDGGEIKMSDLLMISAFGFCGAVGEFALCMAAIGELPVIAAIFGLLTMIAFIFVGMGLIIEDISEEDWND
jgi:hypothetical protein